MSPTLALALTLDLILTLSTLRPHQRRGLGWLVITPLLATVGPRALRSLVITPRSSGRSQVLAPRALRSLVIIPFRSMRSLVITPSRGMWSLVITPRAAGPRRLAPLVIPP